MLQKILKCGLSGGLIVFIVGAMMWFLFPWHQSQFKHFSDEKDVRSTIRYNALENGFYMIPSMNHENAAEMAKAQQQMEEGPFVFAAIKPHGRTSTLAERMVADLILWIAVGCFVAWLLFQTRLDFRKSVVFVTVVGVVFGVVSSIPCVIWFGFPEAFMVTGILGSAFAWFFAGLAMAKLSLKK